MNCTDYSALRLAQLHSFEHPRYFYGQLLGVRHFEAEQEYFKGRLSTAHRMVTGYGVACGLDVQPDSTDPTKVVVGSGYAIDPWGREIVVPCPSKPIAIEPWTQPPTDSGDAKSGMPTDCESDRDRTLQLVLCYKECKTGPEPSMAGDCGSDQCTQGTIRESYELSLRPGCAEKIDLTPEIHDPFRNKPFNYAELVYWVTRVCQPCLDATADPCIVLANIVRPDPEKPVDNIDITVRPIVYTLDVLFELVLALGSDPTGKRGGRTYSAT
jgi:hypothetical protein